MSDESKSPEAEANTATAARESHAALIAPQSQEGVTSFAAAAVVQADDDARRVKAAAAG